MRTKEEILLDADDIKLEGEMESILFQLRNRDYSKVESITFLVLARGMSLADAKNTVHSSKAWSDRMKADNEFHGKLSNLIKE